MYKKTYNVINEYFQKLGLNQTSYIQNKHEIIYKYTTDPKYIQKLILQQTNKQTNKDYVAILVSKFHRIFWV